MPSTNTLHAMLLEEMGNVISSGLDEVNRTSIIVENLTDDIARPVHEDTWRLFQLNERPRFHNQSMMVKIRLRILKRLFTSLQQTVNDIEAETPDRPEENIAVDPVTGLAAFHECINDSGLTLRQLRESFATVTAVNVDESSLSDFDQVLFTTISALGNPR